MKTLRDLAKAAADAPPCWDYPPRAGAALIVHEEYLLPYYRGRVVSFEWDGDHSGAAVIDLGLWTAAPDTLWDTPLPFPLLPTVYFHATAEVLVVRADAPMGLVRYALYRLRARVAGWRLKQRVIATLYVWRLARWHEGSLPSWRWVGRRR